MLKSVLINCGGISLIGLLSPGKTSVPGKKEWASGLSDVKQVGPWRSFLFNCFSLMPRVSVALQMNLSLRSKGVLLSMCGRMSLCVLYVHLHASLCGWKCQCIVKVHLGVCSVYTGDILCTACKPTVFLNRIAGVSVHSLSLLVALYLLHPLFCGCPLY